MKNWNKIILLLITFVALFSSCRKTEVGIDEITTTIYYQPLIAEDVFDLELKSTVKPEVLGDNFIINSISQVNIKATNLNTGYSVYDEFQVTEGGNDFMSLTGVQIGQTLSEINTLSKTVCGPNDLDQDGISWGTYKGDAQTLVYNTLRPLYPYVTFSGSFTHDVKADHNQNNVSGEMTPNNGRLIVTLEMEESLKSMCYGKGILFFNNSLTSDKNWFNKTANNNAYFYLSNENCNNKSNLIFDVYLFDWNEKLLNKWSLKSADYDKLKIENGKDKWVHITITENALTSSVHYGYDLEFPWKQVDSEIGLE